MSAARVEERKPVVFPANRVHECYDKVREWAFEQNVDIHDALKGAEAMIRFLSEEAERGVACLTCGKFCSESTQFKCPDHGRQADGNMFTNWMDTPKPLFIKFEPK